MRTVYFMSPDPSGHDVCRASFVTFDAGLWLFPGAELLPITLPTKGGGMLHNGSSRCVTREESIWSFLGRENAPHEAKADGTAYTHHSLVKLGLRLALQEWRTLRSLVPESLGEHSGVPEVLRSPVRL